MLKNLLKAVVDTAMLPIDLAIDAKNMLTFEDDEARTARRWDKILEELDPDAQ